MDMYHNPKCDGDPSKRFIDGTPQVHIFEKVVPRMYEFFTPQERSNLKFIVMLREPVARDYSWYSHHTRASLASGLPFSRLRTFKEDDSIHRARFGRYVQQLGNFTRLFRRDQILVVNSAEIVRDSVNLMHVVADFLGIEFIPEWNGPFPHDDHLNYPKFKGIIKCLLNHVPELDCNFRDELAAYYSWFNNQLYGWLDATRKQAHPVEPHFIPFGDAYKNLTCVDDARAALNKGLMSNPKESCLDGKERNMER